MSADTHIVTSTNHGINFKEFDEQKFIAINPAVLFIFPKDKFHHVTATQIELATVLSAELKQRLGIAALSTVSLFSLLSDPSKRAELFDELDAGYFTVSNGRIIVDKSSGTVNLPMSDSARKATGNTIQDFFPGLEIGRIEKPNKLYDTDDIPEIFSARRPPGF